MIIKRSPDYYSPKDVNSEEYPPDGLEQVDQDV
jgi:hypothetical protein